MTTSTTHDDGFHEIQLNGKQLVFLFMAATVVSVVIFLCGVLVGRNVRVAQRAVAQAAALNEVPAPDVSLAPPVDAVAAAQAGGDPTTAAPPQSMDDLSYFDRLEKTNGSADALEPSPRKPAPAVASLPSSPKASAPVPVETLKAATPVAVSAAVTKAPAEQPVKETAAAVSAAPAPALATSASTASDGFAVQVAAVGVRGDADAIAKRLSSKGYAAYVQSPSSGTGSVFRVRIGTFKTRHEAETVAARLQKEEQIKPWVTR